MSFIAANGDMVQPAVRRTLPETGLRALSALVLAPVVLAATYVGTPLFELLVTAAAIALSWEWTRVCNAERFSAAGGVCVAATVGAMASGAGGRYDIAVLVLGIGALATAATARTTGAGHWRWTAVGVIAIGICCLALIWLRAAPNAGMAAMFWLFGTVWLTDTGAYFAGRLLGGPKLAPRISPNKTWSGLLGGVVCAALWGAVWSGYADAHMATAIGVSAAAAIIAQASDLSVSALKRRFGIKDASRLIPGHGGVLDRVDGFVLTAPAVAGLAMANPVGVGLPW